MAISLDDLLALRSDKATLTRIDALIQRREDAQKSIATAQADLSAAAAELLKLGIEVEGPAARGRGQARSPRVGRRPKRGGPQARKLPGAKRGPKIGGTRRSAEDYVKALDAVGAEIGKAEEGVAGPAIVAAMAKRGFSSKPVVMTHMRAHKAWKMKGKKRGARYFYGAGS